MSARPLLEIAAEVLLAAAPRRRPAPGTLTILMWHGVSEAPLSPACWQQVALADFRRQAAWVAKRFEVLPLSVALPALAAGTLPPRAAAITFDDGYRNVATNAHPVLAALGLPYTVFLASGTVGTDRVLWADRLWLALARTRAGSLDLRALGLGVLPLEGDAARGEAYARAVDALKALPAAEKDARLTAIDASLGTDPAPRPGPFRALTAEDVRGLAATGLAEFGGHSVTHDLLSRLEDAEVARQVARSHAAAAAWSGRTPVAFAYPNGRTQDFDERARAAVRAAGVAWALATADGVATRESDPLALPRIGIGAGDSLAHVRLHASGALARLSRWRGRG